MIHVRRWGTTRLTSLLVAAAFVFASTLTPMTAQGATIAQTKAEIAQLSISLARQEQRSETMGNQYDAEQAKLQSIRASIVTLDTQEVRSRAAVSVASKALVTAVVRAYVLGVADAQILSLFNQNVTESDARQVYEDQVIGNLTTLKKTYEKQKRSLDSTIAQVALQRSKAQRRTNEMQLLLAQNVRLENSTRATLAVVTQTLKGQIIAYEITMGVVAAKARNSAGEEQAVAAAAAVGGTAAANKVLAAIAAAAPPAITEVAGSAQGDRALKFAESQIGVPYVWGGETPGVGFDCSGLVQWAWAKAGITVARTTYTQWPALHHVSLSALQPGDLLYYYNLDGDHEVDHVVMYAGSGPWGKSTIIDSAHTGTNVSFAPLFTFGLIGAARP